MVATDLAEALARAGMPFHQAHQIVGKLVLESIRLGRKPSDWTAAELAAFAPEFGDAMVRLLDPVEGMKSREIPGGTGPHGGFRGAGGSARAPGADARMSKSFRQGQIVKLIRAKSISTQDDLAQELKKLGITATQVTLSRDIHELRTGENARGLPANRAVGSGADARHSGGGIPAGRAPRAASHRAEDVAGTREFGGGGAR